MRIINYLHVVFAVKNRTALLEKSWRYRLFAYVSKTLSQRGHYALAVNGHLDHIHLFFDYNCKELIADLVREIKKSSNKFVKENQIRNLNLNGRAVMVFFQMDIEKEILLLSTF